MWHKQGFLKTFLLKVAFILMELIFILRKIMYYGIANMPGDRWYNAWMRWPMHLWNYAHGVLHWLWCAGHDAWLMVHVLECMLATVGVMQILL